MRMYSNGIGLMILAFCLSIATMAQVTVTINQASDQSDPANAGAGFHVRFTAVFSQAVTGFTPSDITLSGTAGATQAIISEIAPNNGTTFTVAVIGMTTDGTVIATIPAGVVTGPNSTVNSASTSVDNTITYQLTCVPTCPDNITTAATSPSGANINYDISTFGDCRSMLSLPGPGSSFPIGTTTVNVYTNTNVEYMYVLTSNGLYKFDPGNQAGTLTGPIPITGLPTGYGITSIDFSPTGQLYGLGKYACNGSSLPTCARVFAIDKVTGVATQIGSQDFTLINGGHELEFDPVTNTIHIIGSIYQEHHVMDITTGYTAWTSFKEGSPFMKGVAFSNNFPGTTFTTLYAVGTDGNLHTIGGMHGDPAPSMTAITLVGNLNPDPNGPFVGVSTERTGFDISQRGSAYMISDNNLSSINLNTGEASLMGIFSFATINDFSIEPETLPSPVCSFTVTVNTLQPCEVVCPDDIVTDPTSTSGAVVNYDVTTTGYCPGTITTLPASGSTFPIGTTTVNAYENYSQKVYALVAANNLVSFDIATPNLVSTAKNITGLVQPAYFDNENFFFESIVAIDFRPSNGKLYGLGVLEFTGTAQLYTIDTVSGVATPVGNLTFNVPRSSNYSIDFNPVTDELRLVVGSTSNMRIDPDLGTVIASDPGLDPFLSISGIAYTNSVPSASSTTLYDLSPETNSLYYQGGIGQSDAANNGILTLVGAVGQDFTLAGFDITQAGVGIATLFTTLGSAPFYKIDLATGASTYVNNITIGAGTFVKDIAAAPLTVSPSCSFTVTVNPPQPPTITCPTNLTLSASSTTCTAQYTFLTSNFNVSGTPTPVISIYATNGNHFMGINDITSTVGSSPKSFQPGVYTVTATATNDAGSASCTYTITVVDDTPPTILECPADITVNSEPGKCSALVEFDFRVEENCSEILYNSYNGAGGASSGGGPIYGLFAGRTFSVGEHTMNAVFTDDHGNSSSCSFKITVVDNEKPVITNCPAPVTVSCVSEIPAVNIASVTATDNCGTPTITHVADVISNQICANKYTISRTYKATDGSGNTATCSQTITVDDITPPTITGLTPSKRILAPPNHKMVDITLDYTINDNCVNTPNVTINITSNEPVNGTGDGDTDPDWEVVDDHHIRLRAERAAQGNGRVYTITVTVDDGCNAPVSATTEVVVAHNITGPHSGNAFKVGSTVAFTGEFWDVPGNKHTAKWLIDGSTTAKATVTEPSGNKNGKVTGSYKFTAPGVYKLQMNIIDQNGVTTYANTNGDLEAIIVIYDPNGGHTYGGGYYDSPAGALVSNPSSTGKASYGFAMNYFKNSTNPKGETQFEFKVGEFEYNALNFDYLVISNSMAQFKGTGKIIGGQSGVGFTMTVTDGQLDGSGVDKIRMKIYNKNNGKIIYDNQPGASDAALPTQAVGANSVIVISGNNNSNLTKSNSTQHSEMEVPTKAPNGLDVVAYPNPSTNNFLITVQADAKEKIMMQVVDMYGRIIETRNVSANSIIRFGDRYRPGTYFVRVIQGRQHKELKLIKISD